ncbi:MAG: hypothetical protein KF773_29610 [Deltaproteobacteria bacterium]|nr:hypothetical protein [Deltaproteobacteria bacterium]MCW5807006.1 hypothetical protein [Deltaproteobacteria bacterium]
MRRSSEQMRGNRHMWMRPIVWDRLDVLETLYNAARARRGNTFVVLWHLRSPTVAIVDD